MRSADDTAIDLEHVRAENCPAVLFHASPASNGYGIFEQGLDPALTGMNSEPDAGDGVFMWTTREAAETMIRDWVFADYAEGVVLHSEWDIWQVDATGVALYVDPEFEHTAELSAVYALERIPADRLTHLATLEFEDADEDDC